MSLRLTWLTTFAAALPVLGACTSPALIATASGDAGSGGSGAGSTGGHGGAATQAMASSGGAGGGGAGGGLTNTLSGTVVRSFGGPLEGVTVCVFEQPAIPCVASDAQGKFSIPVPSYSETGVTLAGSGSGSVLVPFVSQGSDASGWEIGLPALADEAVFYGAAGATYPDPASGFLAVFTAAGATQNGQSGLTVAIAPASGQGPLYEAASGATPDPQLQATSTAGVARFAQVAPGVIAVSVSPVASCQLDFGGWPDVHSNAVRVPLAGGFETHVGFACN